jgi:uncharacterized repeat protein (TIGR03803 family)
MKRSVVNLFMVLNIIVFTSYCNAQFTKLLDFTGATNGSEPHGSLIADSNNLYGMTYLGGAYNYGTIFKIKTNGSGFLRLLSFNGSSNGKNPTGSLLLDSTFLYGMTPYGGTNNKGIIFKIKTDGTGFVKLLDFDGATNGANPQGSLISDSLFLYGITRFGGINDNGTIFKIKRDGTGYLKLFDFNNSTDGNSAVASLISDGTYLFGMTMQGGSAGAGIIFKIKPDGSSFAKILDFDGSNKGTYPQGSLCTDGTFLYGMAAMGGSNNYGTIIKIKPDGSNYSKLLDFDLTNKGSAPFGSLITDSSYLYGMTSEGGINDGGVVFKIKTDGSNYLKLLDFDGTLKGGGPVASLINDSTYLYGMTKEGGLQSDGVIFKLVYNSITEINDINEDNKMFKLFPNPASNCLNIEEDNQSEIEILNIEGQIIKTLKALENYTSIDISDLSKGMYFVKIITEKGTEVKKFIKE